MADHTAFEPGKNSTRLADVSAREKWGRDALQLAREVKQPISVRLLEEAAANKRTEGGR